MVDGSALCETGTWGGADLGVGKKWWFHSVHHDDLSENVPGHWSDGSGGQKRSWDGALDGGVTGTQAKLEILGEKMFPCGSLYEGSKEEGPHPSPHKGGGPRVETEKEEPEKSKKLQACGCERCGQGRPVGESQEHT